MRPDSAAVKPKEALRRWRCNLFGIPENEARQAKEASKGEMAAVYRDRIPREKARKVLARGGKLSQAEYLRCKVRYFSDGAVIGGKAFVEEMFVAFLDRFGPKRKDGARPMRGLAGEGSKGRLFNFRQLRRVRVGFWRSPANDASIPDRESAKLPGRGPCPVAIGGGGGGGRMEDGAYSRSARCHALQAGLGVFADTDRQFRLEGVQHGREMSFAGPVEGGLLRRGELVRGPVAAGFLHEDEGAVVQDEVVSEECVRGAESLREQAPQAAPAHLRPGATEPLDRPLGVLLFRFADRGLNPHPVADGDYLAKGDANLGHAPRPRVHPQEDYFLGRVAELREVRFVRVPSVAQRVVDVGHGAGEREEVHFFAEDGRRGDELACDASGLRHGVRGASRVWAKHFSFS